MFVLSTLYAPYEEPLVKLYWNQPYGCWLPRKEDGTWYPEGEVPKVKLVVGVEEVDPVGNDTIELRDYL